LFTTDRRHHRRTSVVTDAAVDVDFNVQIADEIRDLP
jgi:hypothetical protein